MSWTAATGQPASAARTPLVGAQTRTWGVRCRPFVLTNPERGSVAWNTHLKFSKGGTVYSFGRRIFPQTAHSNASSCRCIMRHEWAGSWVGSSRGYTARPPSVPLCPRTRAFPSHVLPLFSLLSCPTHYSMPPITLSCFITAPRKPHQNKLFCLSSAPRCRPSPHLFVAHSTRT